MERQYVYFDEKYKRNAERIIFVDGVCPNALTPVDIELSHWLPNNTPIQYKKDTSTEICFLFLEKCIDYKFGQITSNHFDTDGLLAAFALMYPSHAIEHRDLLEKVSHMGDFGAWQEQKFSIFYDALSALRKQWKKNGLTSEQCFHKGFEALPNLLKDFSNESVFDSKNFEKLKNQRLQIKSNKIIRIEVHSRLSVYQWDYENAINMGLDPFYNVGFDTGLNTSTMLSNQVRNFYDRERMCLIVVKHQEGFFYDLIIPEYLWAETSTLWIPSGIRNKGETNLFAWKSQTEESSKPNLKNICNELNSIDTGAGHWLVAEEFNAFKTIPGKKFPVLMSYINNKQALPSKLNPAVVIEKLQSVEFL